MNQKFMQSWFTCHCLPKNFHEAKLEPMLLIFIYMLKWGTCMRLWRLREREGEERPITYVFFKFLFWRLKGLIDQNYESEILNNLFTFIFVGHSVQDAGFVFSNVNPLNRQQKFAGDKVITLSQCQHFPSQCSLFGLSVWDAIYALTWTSIVLVFILCRRLWSTTGG